MIENVPVWGLEYLDVVFSCFFVGTLWYSPTVQQGSGLWMLKWSFFCCVAKEKVL